MQYIAYVRTYDAQHQIDVTPAPGYIGLHPECVRTYVRHILPRHMHIGAA